MISYFIIPGMIKEQCIIEHIVSKHLGMPRSMMSMRTRKNPICKYRQIMFYFRYKYTMISTFELGNQYNISNHATVLHARKTIQNMIDTKDPLYYPLISKIDKEIKLYLNIIENGK